MIYEHPYDVNLTGIPQQQPCRASNVRNGKHPEQNTTEHATPDHTCRGVAGVRNSSGTRVREQPRCKDEGPYKGDTTTRRQHGGTATKKRKMVHFEALFYLPRGLDVNVALSLVGEAELSPLPFLAVGRLARAVGLLAPPVPDVHHAGKLVPGAEPRL